MKQQKTYKVTGVLNLAIPYDIDMMIDAFSFKQAAFKTYLDLRKNHNLQKIDKNVLYSHVKKLKYVVIE